MNKCTAATPARESKHICILQSIDRLEKAIYDIQGLYDEVVGVVEVEEKERTMPSAECAKQPIKRVPSLVEFLNATPDNIIELSQRIDRLVSDLRSELL